MSIFRGANLTGAVEGATPVVVGEDAVAVSVAVSAEGQGVPVGAATEGGSIYCVRSDGCRGSLYRFRNRDQGPTHMSRCRIRPSATSADRRLPERTSSTSRGWYEDSRKHDVLAFYQGTTRRACLVGGQCRWLARQSARSSNHFIRILPGHCPGRLRRPQRSPSRRHYPLIARIRVLFCRRQTATNPQTFVPTRHASRPVPPRGTQHRTV